WKHGAREDLRQRAQGYARTDGLEPRAVPACVRSVGEEARQRDLLVRRRGAAAPRVTVLTVAEVPASHGRIESRTCEAFSDRGFPGLSNDMLDQCFAKSVAGGCWLSSLPVPPFSPPTSLRSIGINSRARFSSIIRT